MFLFEARLSGYCVREGGSRESTLGAFSTRTLKSSGVPARRVQAGGFCVGMLPLVCSTPACRRAFSCGPSLLRFGVRLSSQDLLVVKLSPLCWLPAVPGERRGFLSRGLLAASGSCKTSCSSCFADASERGVSPRLEVGGSACVAPALRSLSRLRLLLFEARLSGSCVREGESRDLGS